MAVDAKMVKELREKTGAPMMDCREALAASDGDMEKAILYLRQKGIAAASKKMDRATKDGKIVSYIHPGDKLGVLVEVFCETDFVARSPEFAEFTRDIAMQIAAANPRYLAREHVPEHVLEQERAIYRSQAQSSNKPANVIEKIVEGKLEKFFTEVCLLEQPFIKDDKMAIRDVVKAAIAKFGENIGIGRFVRFKLGETA
ncbi:MAG: translation elongation factor Ts [Desulfobacterota bacterium]|nr:translation elongation factor Ts [Thermodesulfobacteriota bacterium]